MGTRLRVVATALMLLSLTAFAFGFVWLERTSEDNRVLATLYRDLPRLPADSRQYQVNRQTIRTLESKRIPYAWPMAAGFSLGAMSIVVLAGHPRSPRAA